MKHKISSFMYKKMVKGLARVLDGGSIPMPDGREPIIADSDADLNIIAWGDPQISALSPLRSARTYSACRDIEKAQGNFDALILAGDVSEYGAWCEYRMAAKLINSIADKCGSIIAVTGNHDIRIRGYKKQVKRFNDFLGLIKNGLQHGEEHYYFSHTINGYKFIMLGADRNAFEASYISEKQLDWLDKELSEAEDGKPVFVINHQTLKNTNGLPESWMGMGSWRGTVGKQSDRIREIFERHSGIIFITGHLHYGISSFSYEDYGSYKALALPTVGVLNHGKNSKLGQGYVITVKGNEITARGRCFCEGRYYSRETESSCIEIKC